MMMENDKPWIDAYNIYDLCTVSQVEINLFFPNIFFPSPNFCHNQAMACDLHWILYFPFLFSSISIVNFGSKQYIAKLYHMLNILLCLDTTHTEWKSCIWMLLYIEFVNFFISDSDIYLAKNVMFCLFNIKFVWNVDNDA